MKKSTTYTSISFDDYERNGMYCKSGFAFPLIGENKFTTANCTTVGEIKWNNTIRTEEDGYSCSPVDQSIKCVLNFSASYPDILDQYKVYESFTVGCGCALDGDNGYCSELIGT